MIQLPLSLARTFAAGLVIALSAAVPTARSAAPSSEQMPSSQNAIEAMDVTNEAGKVMVKMRLKEPLGNPPAAFSLANPPRIAFDFANTSNALGKTIQEYKEGQLRSVRIGETAGRSRVVLNLDRPARFDTSLTGKELLVTLTPVGGTDEPTTFAAARPTQQAHAVKAIDFKRGRNGEGQIIIDLSDPGTGIDLKQSGKTITVDLMQTQLPPSLERRFDVNDFGTPVDFMEVTSNGQNARVSIQARGRWEQAAYQTDNRLVVEVKPFVERQANKQRSGYTGEKLSLNFQNVEVRAVLQVIADFTGLNIVTSDTVSGNLTLRLKDVPWDQALDIILQAKGLDMRKTGNVVWIAPRDELATKEKLALEAQQQIQELEPLRTESFQLSYQKAEAFQKILSDGQQKILSKRGTAVIDPRTNTLFVSDVPTKLEEIRTLLKQIDVPSRQVLIESRIVEASDTFSKNLGARLGFADLAGLRGGVPGLGGGGVRTYLGGNARSNGVLTTQAEDYSQSFFPDSFSVNLPADGINGRSPGQFAVTLLNPSLTRFVNLEISALQADGKGKIISSPRVITADNVEAIIEQGTEIPYQQATSSGATSISFRKATLSLKVKPQITPDDNVIMRLEVHKDSVGANTIAGPSIDTKQVNTEVLVENGGTVSIGGIFTQDEAKEITKVPLLGDVPVFGALFKNEVNRNNRRELLIFVTPKILRDNLTTR
ncbi:MAG TPA: type IV pilus secretin PilQ [Burkholderiales bacterium]|nr:type IV pilus secretin PilQ [Burkholderiales bacterium]